MVTIDMYPLSPRSWYELTQILGGRDRPADIGKPDRGRLNEDQMRIIVLYSGVTAFLQYSFRLRKLWRVMQSVV